MSTVTDFGECVYCGEQRKLTRDHVPPQCLFSKPRPGNLVTVPCCDPCNRDLSKHDEYFRIAVTTGIDREKFPKENADSVRAINNLRRPASQGFAQYLLQYYDRNSSRLVLDAHRIEIVLYRIKRGLFYYHNNVRMSGPIAFQFRLINEKLLIRLKLRELVDRLAANLKTIGPGIFRYGFEQFEPPDPFGTVWLMRFYDNQTYLCVTASE